jgi:hypothetical protein
MVEIDKGEALELAGLGINPGRLLIYGTSNGPAWYAGLSIAAPQAGFGDVEAYPDFATKAAVLCWHLVKNHPLPDGNSAARSWPLSSSWSATAERGSQRPVIRMRPIASSARSRVAT